jgi:hypothetical protein
VIVKVWPKSGNGMPFSVTAEVVVQTGDGELATCVKQPVVLNSESWKSSLLTHGAGGAAVVDVVVRACGRRVLTTLSAGLSAGLSTGLSTGGGSKSV